MIRIDKSNIIRDKLAKGRTSPLSTYRNFTAGDVGLWGFLYYEIATSLFGPLPGGVGFLLRKIFYRYLFGKVGRGLIIGRNVVIRHAKNIQLGNNVTIDDNCLLDGRGASKEGIVLEDNAIIGRNCILQAKAGSIHLGKRTSLGSNSVIVSWSGVEVGESVLFAGGCTISAGLYNFDDPDKAVMDQEAYSKGPIRIGENSWLGTGVIVLDGVTIGKSAVLGAATLVNKNIPDYSIAIGAPAKVVRLRNAASVAS